MSVGTRLKQKRIDAGLEIKEAAHMVKKTYQYVRQIEEGINDPPTWSLLGEFARAYGTSVDYLLELTDNPLPASNDSLPDGAAEIIECMAEMSPRGRAELLTICKSILAVDRNWQELEMGASIAAAFVGEDRLKEVQVKYSILTAQLGSREAALRQVLSDIVADRIAREKNQNLNE